MVRRVEPVMGTMVGVDVRDPVPADVVVAACDAFFATLRDDPADVEMPSARLLLRAGYVRQLGAGIYSLLPLGFRVNRRVEQVIREEMDRVKFQIEELKRKGDFNKVAELQYGRLPELDKQLKDAQAKEAGKKGGTEGWQHKPSLSRIGLYVRCVRTSRARSSATSLITASRSPSTMIRSSGSVPE